MAHTRNVITWYRLGRVEYVDGIDLQRQFHAARKAGLATDTLLLLEHPPILTLGRGAKAENIIASHEYLERKGVHVFETDRGGEVTYHGPGQLVGYPLLHLGAGWQDVRKYIRSIEEVVIRTLRDFGIAATRLERWPGVWIPTSRLGGLRKICALGVHLSRWYTRHGFALNIHPQLEHFELIIPCGIREAGVTSMAAELGTHVSQAAVEPVLARHFGAVFAAEMQEFQAIDATVSVVVLREDARLLLLKRAPTRGGFWQLVTGRVQDNELPQEAALRELSEETNLLSPVHPLHYQHAFALHDKTPPHLCNASAFMTHISHENKICLVPSKHEKYEWCTLKQTLELLPFEGLREAARRAVRGGE